MNEFESFARLSRATGFQYIKGMEKALGADTRRFMDECLKLKAEADDKSPLSIMLSMLLSSRSTVVEPRCDGDSKVPGCGMRVLRSDGRTTQRLDGLLTQPLSRDRVGRTNTSSVNA